MVGKGFQQEIHISLWQDSKMIMYVNRQVVKWDLEDLGGIGDVKLWL